MVPKMHLKCALIVIVTCFVQICVPVELSLEDRLDQQCNQLCVCNTDGQNVNVSCDQLNIDYVPTSLPIDTTYLYLRNNQFQNVTNKTFQDTNMPKLYSLDVSNSNVTIIEENAFKNISFESLQKLFLSNNSLFDTQQLIAVIERFQKLEFIDISNNNGLDCNSISNYFSHSGRVITIDCVNNYTIIPTTVETIEPLRDSEIQVPRQRKPDLHSTETIRREIIDHFTFRPTNSPEDKVSPETVESASPATANTTVSTSPSTTTMVESTSPATTNRVASLASTTEVESTSPSTSTTVASSSSITIITTTMTMTTADPSVSESFLYATWFIPVVAVVCIVLIVFCLVIGWRYYKEYKQLPIEEDDTEMYY